MKRLASSLCGLAIAASFGVALAATQATINRVWVSSITPTSALLSASYNNHDQIATMWFQYHPAQSGVMQHTAIVAETPSSGDIQRHVSLHGLRPGTTYIYRVFVRTTRNEASSGIATFQTPR